MLEKRETNVLKGIMILLMFIHHLFGCGDFLVLPQNQWESIIPFSEEFTWGSKMCLSLGAFISGYGLYHSYIKLSRRKGVILRIIEFLIPYWIIIFTVAIPTLLYINKFKLSYLLVSLFGLLHNDDMLYVSFSWWIKVYLLYLCILPIIRYISIRVNDIRLETILMIAIPMAISFYVPQNEEQFIGITTWLVSALGLIMTWLPCFSIGHIYAKYVCQIADNNKIGGRFSTYTFGLIGMIISLVLTQKNRVYTFFWVSTIIFVMSFDMIYKQIQQDHDFYDWPILSWLGKYSYIYWLLSGMFFLNTVELQWILYLPKYSLIIIVWAFLLMTPVAILIKFISDSICHFIEKLAVNYRKD